jgi:aminoglycoside phosphotransferase (APT) family kinase protein
MTPEPLPKAADAEYLTDALRQCGARGAGRVRNVVVESSRTTLLSRIMRLRLTYDGALEGPASLMLKIGLPDRVAELADRGRREVEFYSEISAVMRARLVPRCIAASWDADAKAWHLLLEDLTDSHAAATIWPLPPTREQCERIVGALARFHAAWWDDPGLGVAIGKWLDADGMQAYMQRFAERYKTFADHLGDRLSHERRDLYERFLDAAPRLLARYHAHRDLCVIHGDAHVWNCLLPRDGGDDIRLLDWGAWRLGVASNDLAHMMALHWYPERRLRMEPLLLDRYHAALVGHGVRGYDRRALADDYRFSTLWQIMTPVWQAAIGLPPVIWWNNLERIQLAVDDLGCSDLLA